MWRWKYIFCWIFPFCDLSQKNLPSNLTFVFYHLQGPVIVITDLSVVGRKPVNFPLLSSSAVVSTPPRECLFFLTVYISFFYFIIYWVHYFPQHGETLILYSFIILSEFQNLAVLSDFSTPVIFHNFFCFIDLFSFLLHIMISMFYTLCVGWFTKVSRDFSLLHPWATSSQKNLVCFGWQDC